MSQERTEAIVLRGVDFSETSRIVTFLCPDRGKVACMAAGARRPNHALSGLLDTFNRIEMVYYWKDGRSVQRLGEATLLDGMAAIKRDLDKALYAAFPLEMAYRAAQENEPSPELYGMLRRGLEGMGRWNGPARTHATWFALQLAAVIGYALGEGEGDRPVGFSFSNGLTGPGAPRDHRLTAAEAEALARLAAAEDACPDVACPASVFDLLRQFVVRQLESEFRSLRVLDQMYT